MQGASQCLMCPPGNSCPNVANLPSNCSAGFFSPGGLIVNCFTCPIGQYCPTPGLASGIICPLGIYCTSTGLSVGIVYRTCNIGQYNTPSGCNPCSPGSFCPDGIISLPCPISTFIDNVSCIYELDFCISHLSSDLSCLYYVNVLFSFSSCTTFFVLFRYILWCFSKYLQCCIDRNCFRYWYVCDINTGGWPNQSSVHYVFCAFSCVDWRRWR
jgi:hypothetical protein